MKRTKSVIVKATEPKKEEVKKPEPKKEKKKAEAPVEPPKNPNIINSGAGVR